MEGKENKREVNGESKRIKKGGEDGQDRKKLDEGGRRGGRNDLERER